MSIIAMAIYDPEEANKSKITERCLDSLAETVDLKQHRLFLIDNNSCAETKQVIRRFQGWMPCTVITNLNNLGTAEAINLAWKHRKPGEHAMKIDNDVVWHQKGWLEILEEAISRMPEIGILGLKRVDCWENTKHPDPQYRSELIECPHTPGQRWIHLEKCKHIIGTCQLYNSDLLDKIGYLYQPSEYGYDDVLASYRSELAGFINVFYPHILIDHIDPGGTPYQTWKERHSGEQTQNVINIVNQYISGQRPIYYTPFKETEC
jgi:GT2 family glycosyltransferase